MTASDDALLTLEPLIDAIRTGVEGAGWELSGLQKTTSHQFEGRWEGEASRSAYLFFHLADGPAHVSIDVFVDETTRGLTGNLALVVEGPALGTLGDAKAALDALTAIAGRSLPEGYRTPLTLRFRVDGANHDAAAAETEIRFKLRIPRSAIEGGAVAVSDLAALSVRAFQQVLSDPELERYAAAE